MVLTYEWLLANFFDSSYDSNSNPVANKFVVDAKLPHAHSQFRVLEVVGSLQIGRKSSPLFVAKLPPTRASKPSSERVAVEFLHPRALISDAVISLQLRDSTFNSGDIDESRGACDEQSSAPVVRVYQDDFTTFTTEALKTHVSALKEHETSLSPEIEALLVKDSGEVFKQFKALRFAQFLHDMLESVIESCVEEETDVAALDVSCSGEKGGHAVGFVLRVLDPSSSAVEISFFDPNYGLVHASSSTDMAEYLLNSWYDEFWAEDWDVMVVRDISAALQQHKWDEFVRKNFDGTFLNQLPDFREIILSYNDEIDEDAQSVCEQLIEVGSFDEDREALISAMTENDYWGHLDAARASISAFKSCDESCVKYESDCMCMDLPPGIDVLYCDEKCNECDTCPLVK
eukprot:gnl/Spiro4/28456_TR14055_c0_g1_i1.p1 gnl/Spiro4/28456_TR14055_c0_g1~~gnl/Spiro4/28456_TR14055_c0_g1_i1.p1  ORF type:complete len:402 (+),score=105.60 gnl/Spiro4/28456_TR14055_c0_g1_i1:702-1907(+)